RGARRVGHVGHRAGLYLVWQLSLGCCCVLVGLIISFSSAIKRKAARFGSKCFDRRRRVYTAMKFSDISIDFFENTSSEPAFLHGIIRLNAGARIVKSTIRGPLFLNKNSQVGPDVVTGKYFGMNESCFVARATVGSFGAIGARTAI